VRESSSGKPSFLCFITDQQRADHLGCMGNTILRTPNIDRIAAGGVRFTQAYVSNPLCMPGRATLFTGLTPRGHGVRTNGIPLDPTLPTMTEALRQAGYRTHAVGKVHLRPFFMPEGSPAEAITAEEWAESSRVWLEGSIERLPSPYYGLESVEFVGGHGTHYWGDYRRWLDRESPGAIELLLPDRALAPLTGAEGSWRSAMPESLHPTCWIADRAIEFLRAQDGARPFFLWCSFPDPHHPYCPPAPYAELYRPADVALPTRRAGELDLLPPHFKRMYESRQETAGRLHPTRMPDAHVREIIAHTYGMIACIDNHIGRVLDTLDETGMAENTVVVFLSDHGDLLGDHWLLNKGPFHFDGLVRVPFLWRWPGVFPAATTCSGLASLLDFAPTVLDLAGVPMPDDPLPGVALTPMLTGDRERLREVALIENDEDYLAMRLRTLVTEDFKITAYAAQSHGELFDRRNDPDELHNHWDDPQYATVKHELLAQLLDEIMVTERTVPRRLSHA
jgi:arylsulfatase A-like enzyme